MVAEHKARASLSPRGAVLATLLVGLALGLGAPGRAGPLEARNLFDVAVPVVDQGRRTRSVAEREALETLLRRLTPKSALAGRPAIAEALRTPERYYRSASYAPGGAQSPWLLTLGFDRAAVLSLLAQAELPAWVSPRPRLLLWLVAEEGTGQRRLLDGNHPFTQAVLAAGADRALPLVAPLLDLEDLQRVAPWQVWGRFWDALGPLRNRYGAEGEVIVRLREEGEGWYLDYAGYGLPVAFEGALRTEAPAVALQAVGQGLAEALLERMALRLSAEGEDRAFLRLDGVETAQAYTAVLRSLKALAGVAEVFVLEAQGDALLLRLTVTDAPARVLDQLDRDGRFEATVPGPQLSWQGRWKG